MLRANRKTHTVVHLLLTRGLTVLMCALLFSATSSYLSANSGETFEEYSFSEPSDDSENESDGDPPIPCKQPCIDRFGSSFTKPHPSTGVPQYCTYFACFGWKWGDNKHYACTYRCKATSDDLPGNEIPE